ncbi:hypothetical protein H072_2533 [Dactylellina haptotyla CBS 200.50]|uniref:L-2-hydroxyglutarate dehydrogenase, mitochondrial n=1 Tax=Dactylellina haptotyla (strain CBS 200.50) TaxID=1284197 RepID=S8BVI4_DACHA|nr:hypothetical protein H072_2533 [Dactylellina haptotyla CBS 200.50]
MCSRLFQIQRRLLSTTVPSNSDFAHCVIGGGVVGLAVASRLATKYRKPTLLIERHGELGTETSSRNSEVVHAGIYYPERSLKTKLCIRGKNLLYDLCEKQGIPHKRLGKWILAQNEKEREILEGLHEKCKRLGVSTNFVGKEEALRDEPDVHTPYGALSSPTTGIVSVHDYMTYLAGLLEEFDISVLTDVVGINKAPSGGYEVTTRYATDEEPVTITADVVINSAGLSAPLVSNMLLPKERHITPFYAKGNYFSYSASKPRVSRLIYPCPVEGLGGLGTHLTLDMAGRIRFGPDVEWVDGPDDLVARDYRLKDAIGAVSTYLPGIQKEMLTPDYCGVRPKLHPKGGPFQDFIVREEEGFPGFVNLLGIESPGLTSSLGIAEMVDEILYK